MYIHYYIHICNTLYDAHVLLHQQLFCVRNRINYAPSRARGRQVHYVRFSVRFAFFLRHFPT